MNDDRIHQHYGFRHSTERLCSTFFLCKEFHYVLRKTSTGEMLHQNLSIEIYESFFSDNLMKGCQNRQAIFCTFQLILRSILLQTSSFGKISHLILKQVVERPSLNRKSTRFESWRCLSCILEQDTL